MTATDELRRLLDAKGVEHYDRAERTLWGDCLIKTQDGKNVVCRFCAEEVLNGLNLSIARVTPEQAIAVTLGGEPDETELTQTYDVGFRNGVMAVFQLLEGIEDYEELQDLIAEYWDGGEGCDAP